MNDSRILNIATFLKVSKNLIKIISDKFPYNKQIMTMKSQVLYYLSSFPSASVDSISEYLLPFKDQIKNEDERFFVDMFNENKQDLDQRTDTVSKLFSLGTEWNELDCETKKSLWMHVNRLIDLSVCLQK